MSNYEEIGAQFVELYYNLFNPKYDEDSGELFDDEEQTRDQLFELYKEDSVCTIPCSDEFTELSGAQDIMEALCQHNLMEVIKIPEKITCQPAMNDTILVLVQGQQKMDPRQEHALIFSEVFIIEPNEEEENIFIVSQIWQHGGF